MKEVILKRERVFHFLSLGIIAFSMFIKDPVQKMTVLEIGILGLLVLSALKKQKILVSIYLALFFAAAIFYYLMTTGKLNF